MRIDLRVGPCFPYPPSEDQGNSVSCVAYSFSTALFCARPRDKATDKPYPRTHALFNRALEESDHPERGVSFEALASALEETYAQEMDEYGVHLEFLHADDIIEVLRSGTPVVAGYQVDEAIRSFHENADRCKSALYTLPGIIGERVDAHCVLIVGYDDSVYDGSFIARNSFGRDWGIDGHFVIKKEHMYDGDFFTDFAAIAKD